MKLIHLLIAGVIALIAFIFIFNVFFFFNHPDSVSYGINGIVEKRCIDGQLFVISNSKYGNVNQVLGPDGKPVTCKE